MQLIERIGEHSGGGPRSDFWVAPGRILPSGELAIDRGSGPERFDTDALLEMGVLSRSPGHDGPGDPRFLRGTRPWPSPAHKAKRAKDVAKSCAAGAVAGLDLPAALDRLRSAKARLAAVQRRAR